MREVPFPRADAQLRVNTFIQSVYNWMIIGLSLTGLVAYFVLNNIVLYRIIAPLMFPLLIGELILVFVLAGRIDRMRASTATAMYLIYSAVNGMTLSVILYYYTSASVASVFFICATTFGACSVYGMVTKKDLTSWGSFLYMGLVGIIIASIVNLIFPSPVVHMVISYIGVLVFVGLTIYDTKNLKMMAQSQPPGLDASVYRKGAIIGALRLYLDFINMFLFLLRIFGGRD